MAMFKVDGADIRDPSAVTFGIQDISAADAGRGADLTMYKGRLGQKQTIQLVWNNISPADTAAILTAFDPEYFNVTYTDPKLNATVTKSFYAGDRSAPVQQWFSGGKLFSSRSMSLMMRFIRLWQSAVS